MSELFTRRGTPKVNTVEVYRGPSRIDGAPIVVLVTGLRGSTNAKTGSMVQSYILRADVSPLDALRSGLDVSICGGCIHRPQGHNGSTWTGRSCYVNVAQAPTGLFKAWLRGSIPSASLEDLSRLVAGRMVRLGSYGDPAAVPVSVWDAYCQAADGWTGYTHQARNPKLRDVLAYCQISADSREDAIEARRVGLGSFRVLAPGEAALPFEMLCPASEEAGRKATCADCKACNGWLGESVVIAAHGIGARHHTGTTRRPLSLPVLNAPRAVNVLNSF